MRLLGVGVIVVVWALAPAAAAAPGGGRLIVDSCVPRDGDLRTMFHALRADGSGVRRVRSFPTLAAPFECTERYPSWAPDGRRFAYTRGDGVAIGSVNRSRARDRTITPSGLWPAWSPTGDRIAFVLPVAEDLVALAVVGVRSGRVRRLVTSDISIEWPSWSPDGRRILYSTNDVRQPGQVRMWRVSAAGGPPRALGRGRSIDQSPDGRWIAFGVGEDVWTMRPDGSGRRRLVDHRDASRTWRLAWSRDGRRLAYVHYPEPSGPVSRIRVVGRDGRGRRAVRLPRRVGFPNYVHWGSG